MPRGTRLTAEQLQAWIAQADDLIAKEGLTQQQASKRLGAHSGQYQRYKVKLAKVRSKGHRRRGPAPQLDHEGMRQWVAEVAAVRQRTGCTIDAACTELGRSKRRYYRYVWKLNQAVQGRRIPRKTTITGLRCRHCGYQSEKWLPMQQHLEQSHQITVQSVTAAIRSKTAAYVFTGRSTTALAQRPNKALSPKQRPVPVTPTPANYTVQEIVIPVPIRIRIAIGGIQIGESIIGPPEGGKTE